MHVGSPCRRCARAPQGASAGTCPGKQRRLRSLRWRRGPLRRPSQHLGLTCTLSPSRLPAQSPFTSPCTDPLTAYLTSLNTPSPCTAWRRREGSAKQRAERADSTLVSCSSTTEPVGSSGLPGAWNSAGR